MKKTDRGLANLLLIIILAITGAVLYFIFAKDKNDVISLVSITPSITVSPTSKIPTNAPKVDLPVISTPLANAKISSPVTVKGTVPPGWMFEGTFPIKIYWGEEGILAQGQAYETTPGSWQSGEPVEFEASITFPKRLGFGKIVLENDNPSGLPENSNTFEVVVVF